MPSRIRRRSRNGEQLGGIFESVILTITQESGEINGRDDIWSIAFLVDGRHVVGGGEEGKIRCCRVEDDKEVGMPMDAGSAVGNLAVSHDGKWVVSGTTSGQVAVWARE